MAYKLLAAGERGLRSAVPSASSPFSVKYEPDSPTRGEAGPLFVFKHLEDAIDGRLSITPDPTQIWRCRTKNLRQQTVALDYIGPAILFSTVVRFWKMVSQGYVEDMKRLPTHVINTVEGTYVADEVTLTKRVR